MCPNVGGFAKPEPKKRTLFTKLFLAKRLQRKKTVHVAKVKINHPELLF